MNLLLFAAKRIGGPGSIGFLACGCAAGLCLIYVWPRNRAAGRWWLFGLYLAYVVMSVPAIAQVAAASMNDSPAGPQPVTPDINAVMVFGGDNIRGRVVEAERIWSAANPPVVIASGDEELVRRLVSAGIPADRIVQDGQSETTREQVHYLDTYLSGHPRAHVAVVASRLQMPRVIALMRQSGLGGIPYPSSVDREPSAVGLSRFVPAYSALRVTRDALYERAALAYYGWRAWIGGSTPSTPATAL